MPEFPVYLNIFTPLQVKNKPRDRDSEHAFILGPYMVQLQTWPSLWKSTTHVGIIYLC
jgi:hypothetical protein